MQAATWAPQIQVRIPPELNGAAVLHGSWLFFWQLESPGGEFTGDLSVNLSVCPFTHPSIHTCIYPTKPEGKNMYVYLYMEWFWYIVLGVPTMMLKRRMHSNIQCIWKENPWLDTQKYTRSRTEGFPHHQRNLLKIEPDFANDGIIADIQLNISHAAEPGWVPADERLSTKHSKDFWVLTSADTQSLSRIGSITKELQAIVLLCVWVDIPSWLCLKTGCITQ